MMKLDKKHKCIYENKGRCDIKPVIKGSCEYMNFLFKPEILCNKPAAVKKMLLDNKTID